MKSKLVILSLLLSGAAVVATAQTKEKYYSESWKDNIFISVGVGAQAGTNPDTKFGKTVTPLINLSVGKYISPIWGVRGQIYGWQSKQETAYPFLDLDNRKERKENYVGLNADAMLNLTNLICGYNPDRLFELSVFAGPSVNIVKNYADWQLGYKTDAGVTTPNGDTKYTTTIDPATTTPVNHDLRWLVGASVGVGAKFNVNRSLAIDVEARGQVTPSILCTDEIAKLMPEVRDFEPMEALDGKEDGLYFYRKIIGQCKQYLNPEGHLLFEIGYDQGQKVSALMREIGFHDVQVIKDLARKDRVVTGML